jgi:hypothetical protein
VAAESDHGGHTDLLIHCPKFYLDWIGECKVHHKYEDLDEGMLQLHTRYANGRCPSVAFVVFCFNKNALAMLEKWKTRLVEKRLCGLFEEPVDDPDHKLTFTTRHRHEGSGLEFKTRHMIVSLYWKPKDKSGRKSRG